jgi:hypothetical protein
MLGVYSTGNRFLLGRKILRRNARRKGGRPNCRPLSQRVQLPRRYGTARKAVLCRTKLDCLPRHRPQSKRPAAAPFLVACRPRERAGEEIGVAGAVLVIVPSPLVGKGNSMERTIMGGGLPRSENPSPIRVMATNSDARRRLADLLLQRGHGNGMWPHRRCQQRRGEEFLTSLHPKCCFSPLARLPRSGLYPR